MAIGAKEIANAIKMVGTEKNWRKKGEIHLFEPDDQLPSHPKNFKRGALLGILVPLAYRKPVSNQPRFSKAQNTKAKTVQKMFLKKLENSQAKAHLAIATHRRRRRQKLLHLRRVRTAEIAVELLRHQNTLAAALS